MRDDTKQSAEDLKLSCWEDGSLKVVTSDEEAVLTIELDDRERREFKRWKERFLR
jgi:hypothetical protein